MHNLTYLLSTLGCGPTSFITLLIPSSYHNTSSTRVNPPDSIATLHKGTDLLIYCPPVVLVNGILDQSTGFYSSSTAGERPRVLGRCFSLPGGSCLLAELLRLVASDVAGSCKAFFASCFRPSSIPPLRPHRESQGCSTARSLGGRDSCLTGAAL